MKRSFFSLVLSSVLLLSGCASGPRVVAPEVAVRDVSQELAVGREIAARLVGRFGLVEDPVGTEYVSLVGQSLARLVGRSEISFTFGVLNTDTVNACAAPGGFIFITRGLLRQLRSEAELAAVLAHEIAHVNARHLYAQLLARPKNGPAPTVGTMVGQGIEALVGRGLGASVETEADEAAAFFLQLAGYDASAISTLLTRVHDGSDKLVVSSAYPPFRHRLRALRKALKHDGFKVRELAADPGTDARFQKALGRWISSAGGHGLTLK